MARRKSKALKKVHQKRARLARYGLGDEAYKRLVMGQQGRCKICEEPRPLVVDHCHANGQVRGLLCQTCNTALGKFQDNVRILLRAIRYLDETGRTADKELKRQADADKELDKFLS